MPEGYSGTGGAGPIDADSSPHPLDLRTQWDDPSVPEGCSGTGGAGPTDADNLLAMLRTAMGNAWFQDDRFCTKSTSNQRP